MSKETGLNSLVIQSDGVNDFYKGTVQGILEEGKIVVSRGLEKKEIRPVTLILNSPRERFLTCPGRMIHPYFQIMESIWVIGGRGDVEWISYYLKDIAKYSDGQAEFHAPYGIRMRHAGRYRDDLSSDNYQRDQFKHCYEYLKKDPHTQHAVMTFWSPMFDDYIFETIDRPCNIALQFLFRDGALDLTICNRSNDIHWGLANVNVVQFSVMLETMAMLLGVTVGNQIHMVNSLHYYTDSSLTQKVLLAEYEFNMYEFVSPSHFQHEAEDLTLEELDGDLEYFFIEESLVREGGSSAAVFSFSFLEDAIDLAMSFFEYKKQNIENAFYYVGRVQADDIFVTCAEFLARKITGSSEEKLIEDLVRERFKNKIGIESINRILHYIFTH